MVRYICCPNCGEENMPLNRTCKKCKELLHYNDRLESKLDKIIELLEKKE